MNLQISVDHQDDKEILHLNGEIDAYTATALRETLVPLTECEHKQIIVDLSNVNYMDSTGLGVFIGALKSTKKYNSSLTLTGATERVRRLFTITGLNEVIHIEDEIEGVTK